MPVGVAVGVAVEVGVDVAVYVGVGVAVGVEVAVGGLTIKATCSALLEKIGPTCIAPIIIPTKMSTPKLICKKGSGFASRSAPHSGQVRRMAMTERPQTRQRIRPSVTGFSWPH